MKQQICILGSTGSIGTQALDVISQHPDLYEAYALTANRRWKELAAQARRFHPAAVVIADETFYEPLVKELADMPDVKVYCGSKALEEIVESPSIDMVLTAMVGYAGLAPTIHAVKAKKRICLANKETLVVAGELILQLAQQYHTPILPVDSEHSAIFQCLVGEKLSDVSKIWLTCSGGPFFGKCREELAHVTVADALAHPTWSMGAKISIDSATLMNKGLEILEAHHLFETPIDDIHVLIHQQSRIHSMVEFVDGSVKGQLGPSDMRIPIQYALSYPERWQGVAQPVLWGTTNPLTCAEPDEETFGCLALAKQAGRAGGTAPCVMNAANEIANEAFRLGKIGFLDIERIVSSVIEKIPREPTESIAQLSEIDAHARALAQTCVLKG